MGINNDFLLIDNISKDCIRSLSFEGITGRRNNISLAHRGTCEWLFETTSFREWKDRTNLQNNNGVLWIKGHPGVGKSTLMKHTLLRCQKEFKDHSIAFYFFNARGSLLEKSLKGMLRSLMVQLLEQDSFLLEQFNRIYVQKETRHRGLEWKWEWEIGELKEFLLLQYERRQCKDTLILVDALDECNDTDVQEVVDFLENLSENAIQSGSNLRICLSSRHYPHIDMKKKIELVVEQQAEHDQDIANYVQSKLKAPNEEIYTRILEKAKHIFIWVVLVVELLNREFNKGKITAMKKKLNEMPSDLDELLSKLLEKENADDRKLTILVFQWVLFSVRPLRATELYFGAIAGTDLDDLCAWDRSQLSFEDIRRFITSTSRGLIEIATEDTDENDSGKEQGNVRFIHQSVIDFLTRNQRLVKLDSALAPDPTSASQSRLASCCMNYIMQEKVRSFAMEMASRKSLDEVKASYPFLEYASSNLLAHAENAQAEGISQGQLLRQLEKHENYDILQSFHDYFPGAGSLFYGARLLYAMSLQGCYYLLQALLLECGPNVNDQGGYYGNALQAAVAHSSRDVVELLLKHGADPNAQGGHYSTALYEAAACGFRDLVELLLKHEADPNAQGGHYGNALQAAAANSYRDIVELLLKHKADPNAQGGHYSNALQAAAADGCRDIVELLLKHEADPNAQGGYYCTALQAAVAYSSKKIVELLLKHKADPNAKGGHYGTALQAAKISYSGDIFKLLLEHGADANA